MDGANEAIDLALRIGEAEGLPDVISHAMNTRAILVASFGRYEEGIALLRHALRSRSSTISRTWRSARTTTCRRR